MSKWHYKMKDEVIFNNSQDCRNGIYLCYDIDTFDYLINDNEWVSNNDAFEEQEYIIDHLDMMLESNNGCIIFIPDVATATKIENYYALKDMNYVDEYNL